MKILATVKQETGTYMYCRFCFVLSFYSVNTSTGGKQPFLVTSINGLTQFSFKYSFNNNETET